MDINLDDQQLEIDHITSKFNAYSDSSIDMLNTTKRMLEAGLYKEAGMNAEDFAAYAYQAEQALHSLIAEMKTMDEMINLANSKKGYAESHE